MIPARIVSALRRMRLWQALVLAAVVVAGAVGIALAAARPPSVTQPIAFNHRHHVADLGLTCDLCHKYVRVGAHAGLPDGDTCAICHRSQQGDTAEAARLTQLLTEGAPVRFRKLFRLPDHVFYTHRRHVGIAELECVNCHGPIAETERPPGRALVQMSMDVCMDCHREQGQTQNCNACHR